MHYVAQYFSQRLPEPSRNIYTPLCIYSRKAEFGSEVREASQTAQTARLEAETELLNRTIIKTL